MNIEIISQRIKRFLHNEERFFGFIDWFCLEFKVEELLERYGFAKKKGHKSLAIFKYLVSLPFYRITHHTDLREGITGAPFSRDTIRKFLDNPKADWISFTTELSLRVLRHLRPGFGEESKPFFFIIDDTDYERPYTNYAEEISWQWDHNHGKAYKGYKLDALSAYYNGVILPISGVFVSTADSNKVLNKMQKAILTPAESRRRRLALGKGPEAMLEQLKEALRLGFPRGTVLFDSWYTHPRTVLRLVEKGFEVIGMLKANGRTRFGEDGRWLTVREIFEKKSPQSSKESDGLLFSAEAASRVDAKEFPLLLVFAENVHEDRDYVCLASTDLSLDAQSVLSYYRHRFTLETIFKDLKNPALNLLSGNRSLSLNAMSGYLAIVLCRYMIILAEKETASKPAGSIQAQAQKMAHEERTVNCLNAGLDMTKVVIEIISEKSQIPTEQLEEWASGALANSKVVQKLWNDLPDCTKS